MSVEALTYAARVKVGNITAKFVLGRLADRADERFSCYPSIPLIAAEAEKSERTVQRALEHLETLRLISTKDAYRDNGSQASNRYFLHGPWDQYAGTGTPFPEIVTPKEARSVMWAQQPQEGKFREGSAAAVALSGSAELLTASAEAAAEALREATEVEERRRAKGRKASAASRAKTSAEPTPDETAVQQGVTSMSPPPVTWMSPPPVTLMSPLEPSVTTPTTEPLAPSARSANDARRASAGSSARGADSGSAATTDEAGPVVSAEGLEASPGGVPGPRMSAGRAGAKAKTASKSGKAGTGSRKPSPFTPEQREAIYAAEALLPKPLRAALAVVLPHGHLPNENRKVIAQALESRTPAQLGERAARRFVSYGYDRDAHDGGLRSPIGVVEEILRPTPYCPEVDCEDGVDLHTGAQCTACETRIRERLADRKAGRWVPTHRPPRIYRDREHCGVCDIPFRADAPEDRVCAGCQEQLEAGAARLLASDAGTQAAEPSEPLRVGDTFLHPTPNAAMRAWQAQQEAAKLAELADR